ncbi:MAG: methanogenesis marker 14 protein [Candidatus Thorarchaeota archaeon]|nr:methanogenesis marker 14 protein [Candidatus Thorarchaeota archaeon]
MGPFYTVASVELGNTTTKCILVSTNLQTAEIYEIAKEVRMTRDVRPPLQNEQIFGETLFGVPLTRESVSEMVSDVLTSVITHAGIDMENDLHFVVRSTGVTASFANPSDVGIIVQALADGCIKAGIPPRKMTAAMTVDNLPPGLRDFTWLRKVYFDGAIAASLPPTNTEIVANEMEGELVTAGIKGAVKGTDIDFRNPVMSLDFGTTLAGRITDNEFPYAKTIGSFAGLAGAIPDAIVRGSSLVPHDVGCVLDIPHSNRSKIIQINESYLEAAQKLVEIKPVPHDAKRFGSVPVNPKAAEDSGVVLIGVNANLKKLELLGAEVSQSQSEMHLLALIDRLQFHIVQQLVAIAESEHLLFDDTSLGLTGRAIITGQKPRLISEGLKLNNGNLWTDSHQLVFVEDGLAMGAAVAARCMNSMGTTRNPMGGRKGDRCIMTERMKLQSKRSK